jgi:hypothetical protein
MKELLKLANELDKKGLQKEADVIDSFVKEAGFMSVVGGWVAGKLDPETLAAIADQLDPERLAMVAKAMDKEKQKDVIRILVQDPEIRAVAFEALNIDPNLGNLGFDVLRNLQGQGLDTKNLPPEVAALAGSAGGAAATSLKDLQNMFGASLQKGDPIQGE